MYRQVGIDSGAKVYAIKYDNNFAMYYFVLVGGTWMSEIRAELGNKPLLEPVVS